MGDITTETEFEAAYIGLDSRGRVLLLVPCPDGCWHERLWRWPVEPGDRILFGSAGCKHPVQVSPVPFDPRWRSHGGRLTPSYAFDQVKPTDH